MLRYGLAEWRGGALSAIGDPPFAGKDALIDAVVFVAWAILPVWLGHSVDEFGDQAQHLGPGFLVGPVVDAR